ncbi:hypothetical protein [Marinomonas sp.]
MRHLPLLLSCSVLICSACSYQPVPPARQALSHVERLALIQTHLLLGQWSQAKTQLELTPESGRQLEYWRLKSLYALSVENSISAMVVHKEGLLHFSEDDFLLNNYGVLLGQVGAWQDACEAFRKASNKGLSIRQSVWINLARCAIRQYDVNLATVAIKEAKEIADLPLLGLMTELNLVLIQDNLTTARLILKNIQADKKIARHSVHFEEYNCLSRQVNARETDLTLYSSASAFSCLNSSRY